MADELTPEQSLRSDADFAAAEADRADEAVARAENRVAKVTDELAQMNDALATALADRDAKRALAADLAAQVAALPVEVAPAPEEEPTATGEAFNASVRIS